jgi:regulator of replication initiation timing
VNALEEKVESYYNLIEKLVYKNVELSEENKKLFMEKERCKVQLEKIRPEPSPLAAMVAQIVSPLPYNTSKSTQRSSDPYQLLPKGFKHSGGSK